MKQIYKLSHGLARKRAEEAVRTAPDGYIVEIKEPNRSLDQNAMIHALLTDVGDMIGWRFAGESINLEDLKTIFMAAYRKATGEEVRLIKGIDGQPIILNWRTRELSKREGANFIDMVDAWLAEHKAEHENETIPQ